MAIMFFRRIPAFQGNKRVETGYQKYLAVYPCGMIIDGKFFNDIPPRSLLFLPHMKKDPLKAISFDVNNLRILPFSYFFVIYLQV